MSDAPKRIKARMKCFTDGTYSIAAYLPGTPTTLPDGTDGFVDYIRADLGISEGLRERAEKYLHMVDGWEDHSKGFIDFHPMAQVAPKIADVLRDILAETGGGDE